MQQKGSDLTESVIFKDVSKTYKRTHTVVAIHDVSLVVEKGEFFCLVGPSGCGKSTILKLIAGLEQPTGGSVHVSGKVSMVFQSAGLLPWMTVTENVEFGMKMLDLERGMINERTKKYLSLVNLDELHEKYPRELSGGQRQRVGLARALAVEPDILLLDEPFSALDTLTTDELHGFLLKIWTETQKTIIMVSHLLPEAVLLSDKIAVMREGTIVDTMTLSAPHPRNPNSTTYHTMIGKMKKEFVENN